MIIRRATLDDMPDAAMVHLIARRVNLPYLPQNHSRDEVMGHFLTELYPTSQVWVSRTEDSMITGYAASTPGWLNHLYILPDYQGSGLGGKLLNLALEGQDEMQLWTFQQNKRARAFYEKRGFSLIRETDGADNMEKTPDALYAWRRPVA